MFSKDEVEAIINVKITADENPGEQAGGSGHMGYVSCTLDDYSTKQIDARTLEVTYRYTVFVETEFTYYPDNPPTEYRHEKRIVVNPDQGVIHEEELSSESSLPFPIDMDRDR